ncbi:O-antigen ligase family protein [Aestuariibaculum sediminum]|uniref:O-antigen ligase family protein n=1 Tax=Aestuariibaculum sediminum TaxID=2770637 RepID=A0A8J6UE78_9FLAO|nr:O-antigen ligase family protein [Aestuariibaculum sediminum]MBD0833714.1 O-antigen ligase family protein [Aestuariibaculum sediminum]
MFLVVCLLIFGVLIFRFLFSKNPSINLSILDIGLFILLLYVLINRYVIQIEFGFSIRYIELLGISLFYLVLRSLSVKVYSWLFLTIILSSILQAIHGNLQLLDFWESNHSGFKITGSFFNPGPYAGFLASVWPVSLGMYFFKDKFLVAAKSFNSNTKIVNSVISVACEYIPLIGLISVFIVLPSTQSRAAWLAVIMSSTLLIEYKYSYAARFLKSLKGSKKIYLAILVFCVFAVGILGVYHFKKASADGRLFVWNVSSGIIKDNPLTGVGFDRFKAHYMDYQATYFKSNNGALAGDVADNTYYAFNEWLQFIVEEGFLGFVILLFFLWCLYKVVKENRNKHPFIMIATSILLSIGVFSFFSYSLQILPIKLLIITSFAFLANSDQNKFFRLIKIDSQLSVIKFFKGFLAVLGFVIVFKGYEYSKYLEDGFITWKNAITVYQYGDYEGCIDEYQKVYQVFKKDGDFLMNYGKALTMSNKNEKAIQILEKSKIYLNTTIIQTALGDAYKDLKQYKKAEKAYEQAYNMIPIRFYPLYLLAKLYDESGDKQKALEMADEILNKETKIPSTAIREIKSEMKIIINKYEGQNDL